MAGVGITDPNAATAIVEVTVNEDSAFDLTGQLKDNDVDIALADLSTITLTLFLTRGGDSSPAGTIINGRDDQDVKNTANVTISATGLLTWSVQKEDTVILNDTITICDKQQGNCLETHRALFQWVLTNGRRGKKVIDLIVVNLSEVP